MSTRVVSNDPFDRCVFHTRRDDYELTTRDNLDSARQQVTILCRDVAMRIEDLVSDFTLMGEHWPEVFTHVIPDIQTIVMHLVCEGYLEAKPVEAL